eukprot:9251360-Ditylum_brightwellii.AAC.1
MDALNRLGIFQYHDAKTRFHWKEGWQHAPMHMILTSSMILVGRPDLLLENMDIGNVFCMAPCAEMIWSVAGEQFGNKKGAIMDLWIKKSKHYEGYDYIATHVDDIILVAQNSLEYMSHIEQHFK